MIHNTVNFIAEKIRRYINYNKTVRQLNQLSDKELKDIGIDRGMISYKARDLCHKC